MRPQAYQTPEIRDENDFIIQQGTFGKKTPFVNSQNDGILDYIINNLEAIKGVSLAATIVVSSLPSTGQAGKFYLLDDGTENSGKVYIYKDKWIEVTTQAEGLSAYQVAKKNGYEGTEQEWLENEVYGDDIVSAETDSDGYFIVHTRQGKTIKTALKPLVDAKASADKAKISETNAKKSETNSANSAAAALASQKSATASADSASAAHTSEVNASSSASAASVSAGKAKSSETNAKTSETNAKASELNAKASENNAKSSENLAKAWAMSESSPDGVDGNKSAKTWAMSAISAEANAKQSEINANSYKNAAASSATASANSSSASSASAINSANSAKASASSAAAAKASEANAKASADRANSSLETLLGGQVNADWAITDNTNKAFIKNKPDLTVYATKEELETECVDKINQLNTALKNGFTTASLTVSGETSVPTPSTENNSKTIANTEFVHGVVSDLVNGAPTALDTLQELAGALGNDPNFATTVLNKIGEKENKTDAQIEHKKLQDAIPTKVSQLSNDSGYQKTAEIPVVSQTQNGYMSKSDKAKLDGIAEGATNVTDYVQSVTESNGKVTVTKGGGESTTFSAGLNILARNKAYSVGDIAYSPNLPSYLYLECTTAGTTGETEPDMPTLSGAIVDDGTAQFGVKTVCAKEYVDSKSTDEAQKWKKAYNNLRKRSSPIEFDEDELTLLASDFPPNKSPLKLSQPYTGFDGLYIVYGEATRDSVLSEYIAKEQLEERIHFGKTYWFLIHGVGSIYIKCDSGDITTPTSIAIAYSNVYIYRIYGVKFKEIT